MQTALTDTNKITSIGLVTRYSETYDDTSQDAPFWMYRRVRTKSYSYIALSEEAAQEGVESKLAQYARTFYTWKWQNGRWMIDRNHLYFSECATVRPRSDEADLWTVEIEVDEEAIVYSPTRLTRDNMIALFASCYGTWEYDE